ncbi:MAG: phosphoribosylamine--glycine ligase [Chloroflexota bacterium]
MADYTVLVVGGGGREHAVAWSLARSPQVRQVYAAPGNAGTAQVGQNLPVGAEDISGIVQAARDYVVDLVVVGPEAPLAAGLVDALTEAGILAFGPTRAAAQLEASKAFAKAFMLEQGIPTARYATFDRRDDALAYLDTIDYPVVVKADGLAAGKGVIVCDHLDQARDAVRAMLEDASFGAAGARVIIEERLTGPELSVLAFCDGERAVLMPPTRDHKRIFDGDEGPNTGGMGAFGPVTDLAPGLMATIIQTIIEPTVRGMAARGTPYRGVLYAGLMLTPDGPRTLEFNCRFGDPEAQVVLPLLASDLFDIVKACAEGQLDPAAIHWYEGACATVVAASAGYPGSYKKSLPIQGMDAVGNALVFMAGVATVDGHFVTSGGRVVAVSGRGATLDDALQVAYGGLENIHFEGMHYRKDIGRT